LTANKRGVTLIELLVAASILSLVITMVLSFLVKSASWTQDIREYQGAEQDLSASLSRIAKGLQQAPAQSVLAFYPSTDPTQGDLILAWPTPYDPLGNYFQDPDTFEPIFQGYSIVYLDTATRIVFTSYLPQTPTTAALQPLPADIQLAINPSTDRPLTRKVDKFQVLHPITEAPTSDVHNPCTIRLEIESVKSRDRTLVMTRELGFSF